MGANPHVYAYTGKSEYNIRSLSALSNIPSSKSIFFQLRDFNSAMPSAWEYRTGVYNQGYFGRVRGFGGEGTVIEGRWQNQTLAAFKFVEVRDQKFITNSTDALTDMNERLSEMTNQRLTSGLTILKFEGHYRYDFIYQFY